uniref:TM2 domain-containing protein n=1 Tax=Rhabditophanes sp. KR3021 TaxID=114890 RepID=A0AC35UHJ1_9BILA
MAAFSRSTTLQAERERENCIKILFFIVGILLAYENIYGVLQDRSLRTLATLVGFGLIYIGCRDFMVNILDAHHQPLRNVTLHNTIYEKHARKLKKRRDVPQQATLTNCGTVFYEPIIRYEDTQSTQQTSDYVVRESDVNDEYCISRDDISCGSN